MGLSDRRHGLLFLEIDKVIIMGIDPHHAPRLPSGIPSSGDEKAPSVSPGEVCGLADRVQDARYQRARRQHPGLTTTCRGGGGGGRGPGHGSKCHQYAP